MALKSKGTAGGGQDYFLAFSDIECTKKRTTFLFGKRPVFLYQLPTCEYIVAQSCATILVMFVSWSLSSLILDTFSDLQAQIKRYFVPFQQHSHGGSRVEMSESGTKRTWRSIIVLGAPPCGFVRSFLRRLSLSAPAGRFTILST